MATRRKKTPTTLHTDGWQNVLSGLGISGRDKTQSTTYLQRPPLSWEQCTSLYRQDWVAKRAVNALVKDCFRAGFTFVCKTDEDLPDKMADAWKTAGVLAALADVLRWALVYGGACALMLTDDRPVTNGDSMLEKPLDLRTLRAVKQFLTVDRRYAIPRLDTIVDQPGSPNFGRPAIYQITPYGVTLATQQYDVHWSRLVRMDGVDVDAQTKLANLFWGDSLFEGMFDPLRFHGQAMQGTATTVAEFSQGVLAMRDLSANLASAQHQAVVNRATAFRLGLGAAGVALIDSEYEKYERLGQPVSGLPDLLEIFQREMAGATQTPQSRLYGNQAGAVAGSKEDQKAWADYVHGWQSERVLPALRQVTEILLAAKDGPTGGRPVAAWEILPNPIDPPDQSDEVDRRLKMAQTDKLYFEMNALEPTEIRQSRFGGAKYSIETTLDAKITEELEKQQAEQAKEPAAEPEPEPAPQPPPGAEPGKAE